MAAFDGCGVVFRDGRREDFDVVIAATGYQTTLPFIDCRLLGADPADGMPRLFMNLLHPGRDDIAVVGLIQPDSGQWGITDVQARLVAGMAPGRPLVAPGRRLALRPPPAAAAAQPDPLRRLAAAHPRGRAFLLPPRARATRRRPRPPPPGGRAAAVTFPRDSATRGRVIPAATPAERAGPVVTDLADRLQAGFTSAKPSSRPAEANKSLSDDHKRIHQPVFVAVEQSCERGNLCHRTLVLNGGAGAFINEKSHSRRLRDQRHEGRVGQCVGCEKQARLNVFGRKSVILSQNVARGRSMSQMIEDEFDR